MKLNIKQKKLLKLLAINCRFTNKDLAKAIGLSEDAVSYQINKLIGEEKIGFFNTQFNHFLLGYTSYHVWVNCNLKDIIEVPEIYSINSSFGKYNHQFLIFAKSDEEFKKVIKKINLTSYKWAKVKSVIKMFSNIIREIDVEIKIPKNRKKFEYSLADDRYSRTKETNIYLDEIDKKIIVGIIKKPRASFQELSKFVKVNHETIRYRLKKLVKTKFINNFGLIINYQKFHLYNFYLLLNIDGDTDLVKLFAKIPEISYSARLEGDFDTILYIEAENPLKFGEIYSKIFENINIKNSELLILNKTEKYSQFPMQELL